MRWIDVVKFLAARWRVFITVMYRASGGETMVVIRNTLAMAVRLVKIDAHDEGTLQPGDEAEVTLDAATVRIELQPVPP